MKVFTSKTNWTNATLEKIGTMYLVTFGSIKKMYCTKEAATNYIISIL